MQRKNGKHEGDSPNGNGIAAGHEPRDQAGNGAAETNGRHAAETNGLHDTSASVDRDGTGFGPETVELIRSRQRLAQVPDRWVGIRRDFTQADVDRLSGSVRVEHTLARLGADRLWTLLHTQDYVHALGALTGNQAVQMVRAGLKAIYLSGWQVAADANSAGQMYPDQSLYPVDSVPTVVKRINQAFRRADQIEHSEGKGGRYWFAPIVADAEAGFGGPLNAFELMKSLIEAGAAGVHFEDQLASEKKCGHMGGKVLVPTAQFIRTLVAARLAADVCDVPTLLVARTDADSAKLLLSDVDPRDREFIVPGERTAEGFYRMRGGLECAIARFQRELGAMGYKFQFVTLAGFHALNFGMFNLARDYAKEGMAAYSRLQQAEFGSENTGYTATRHQREVGTSYFDDVAQVISSGAASTLALHESTEAAQF